MTRVINILLGTGLVLLPAFMVVAWVNSAEARLEEMQRRSLESPTEVAVAAQANEGYCTPDLKKILRRVLQSCGLVQGRSGRGCQPADAQNVATMSGDDFNALFIPMMGRGGIIQFDQGSDQLDESDKALIEKVFSQRRGASYFFVVSRASPEGSVKVNRQLSRNRAEQVMKHLDSTFKDAELENQVGLLWLGEEYAQLDPSFCQWERSGPETACAPEELNRSAFIAWIDCRL
jgi:outer membrane protein OmpA-like peptidoglycan-associated protein